MCRLKVDHIKNSDHCLSHEKLIAIIINKYQKFHIVIVAHAN
jgi:hypothetical protein